VAAYTRSLLALAPISSESEGAGAKGKTARQRGKGEAQASRPAVVSPDTRQRVELAADVQAAGQRLRDALAKADSFKAMLADSPKVSDKLNLKLTEAVTPKALRPTSKPKLGDKAPPDSEANLDAEVLKGRLAEAAAHAKRLNQRLAGERPTTPGAGKPKREGGRSRPPTPGKSKRSHSRPSTPTAKEDRSHSRDLYSWSEFSQLKDA
jgi:hypothetical protein